MLKPSFLCNSVLAENGIHFKVCYTNFLHRFFKIDYTLAAAILPRVTLTG